MPFINNCKINDLKTMLMTYFFGADIVSKSTIERKVNSDIIKKAVNEKLIQLNNQDQDQYYITEKGKQYRDS